MNAAVLLASLLLQTPSPSPEPEVTWTVSGALATDMSGLLSEAHSRDTMTQEGIVGEFAMGASAHLRNGLNITVRTCVGCHGFELQNAFVDVDVTEGVTFRAGRIPVPFGAFSQRTHPGHQESSSRPLPYAMGRMVRDTEFNLGIVPAPLVDNGASLTVGGPVGPLQLSAEGAVVKGLVGVSPEFDFIASRDFEDNNGQPAGALRVTATSGAVTAGLSGMAGRYDAAADLPYVLGGGDLHVRLGGLTLRAEGLFRRTTFLDASFEKQDSTRVGYVVQADARVAEAWKVFVMHDGLAVKDLFLSSAGPLVSSSPATTDDSNSIRRVVGGFIWLPRPGLQVKGSAEFWKFSDFDDTWVFHVEVVTEF